MNDLKEKEIILKELYYLKLCQESFYVECTEEAHEEYLREGLEIINDLGIDVECMKILMKWWR